MIGSLTNALGFANSAITTALNLMSSGKRATATAEDPAGLQMASQLAAQISSTGAALSGISVASSLTQTAGGALGQVSDVLQQMRDLAVQAGNGSYSASDRQALQPQFNPLAGSLDDVSRQSQFNGQNLLDSTFNTSIALGLNSGPVLAISQGNTSDSALGVTDRNIMSVSAQQANMGAVQSTLDATSANLSNSRLNLSASLSGAANADMAQASSNLTLATIKQLVAIQAIKLYNATQSQVLAFIAPPSK